MSTTVIYPDRTNKFIRAKYMGRAYNIIPFSLAMEGIDAKKGFIGFTRKHSLYRASKFLKNNSK